MSFNSNDTNHTIHLGNYEEYFILYMDKELSDEQLKMVDAFLVAHPDLQAEFEILMSTKLPAEDFSIDKEALLSDNMKLGTVEEDLLLYIDNELSSDKKKMVELELFSNKEYQLQHQLLAQARLDASEVISYPNKKELYRRVERVVFFTIWMRIAAALIVIAALGFLYFTNRESVSPLQPLTAEANKPRVTSPQQKASSEEQPSQQTAIVTAPVNKNINTVAKATNNEKDREIKIKSKQENRLIASADAADDLATLSVEKVITKLDVNSSVNPTTASLDLSKEIINTSAVTYALSQRNTINAAEPTVPNGEVATNNEHKGSLKGFLRKATRMIERKTGIGPTSGDDEELLIGAVALKLK